MARYGWTPVARERGMVRVHCGGEHFYLRLADRAALMRALERGDTRFDGADNFGAIVRLSLAEVTAVVVFTPESIAATIADDERSEAEEEGEGWREAEE